MQKAGDRPPFRYFAQRRRTALALRHPTRTAGVKSTAARRIDVAGNLARQHGEALAVVGVGDRRQQRLRIRVERFGEQRAGRRGLHQLAQVHHGDPVGHQAHHAQIVRDEQIGEREALLQVVEKVEYLGLDRHVEGGDRLVAHHDAGIERDGAADRYALPLTAGEVGRHAAGVPRRQADRVEQLVDAPLDPPAVAEAVDAERLGYDAADRQPRVERGVRVLEHDLDVGQVAA